MPALPILQKKAIYLLENMIRTPSFSRKEEATATLIFDFLEQEGLVPQREGNNVWLQTRHWDSGRPTLLLNSHHDTVKPTAGWQRDPFEANWEGETLYGLGSNDAGASLVSLITTFLYFEQEGGGAFNLILAATAEEEISGTNGIASLLPVLGSIDVAIVGEPTRMQMAVAEKGLMVVDGTAVGHSGHAAREEGVNALYIALEDIDRIRNFSFERVSPLLGASRATVTVIKGGEQHNLVPDRCHFVIDVRSNELYSNEELLGILQGVCRSSLQARSFRLNSSCIAQEHALVQSGQRLGLSTYGSPTLSDQALMPFPSLKIGPGDSARSHTADEYVLRSEIEEGIRIYIKLIKGCR